MIRPSKSRRAARRTTRRARVAGGGAAVPELADREGETTPTRNRNSGKIKSMKWKPAHSTCCICVWTSLGEGRPVHRAQALASSSPPTIQNMSNPRRASIERTRSGAAVTGTSGSVAVAVEFGTGGHSPSLHGGVTRGAMGGPRGVGPGRVHARGGRIGRVSDLGFEIPDLKYQIRDPGRPYPRTRDGRGGARGSGGDGLGLGDDAVDVFLGELAGGLVELVAEPTGDPGLEGQRVALDPGQDPGVAADAFAVFRRALRPLTLARVVLR